MGNAKDSQINVKIRENSDARSEFAVVMHHFKADHRTCCGGRKGTAEFNSVRNSDVLITKRQYLAGDSTLFTADDK